MQTKNKAMLVMVGSSILGTAYTPIPKSVPTKEFITRVYVRPTGEQKWQASELRKRELLENLKNARAAIKNLSESLQIDRNTRITGVTANQKVIIHSTKLMLHIAECKNCK